MKTVASSNKTGELLPHGLGVGQLAYWKKAESPKMLREKPKSKMPSVNKFRISLIARTTLAKKAKKPLPIVVRLPICTNCSGVKSFGKQYFWLRKMGLFFQDKLAD